MSIKISQLKNIKKCSYKAYINQFNFKTNIGKFLMIDNIYKDIIKNYDFINLSKKQLQQIISEKLDDKYFLTKQEKEIELTTILNYILRYIEYEKSLDRKILKKDINGIIKVGNKNINVSADIAFENKDYIELIKFKLGATKLSYKARKEDNKPENEIELYLMKKLGEKIYSKFNKPIVSSFYHFKGKNEDKKVCEQWLKDKSILIKEVDNLNQQLNICIDKKEKKKIEKQIKTILDVMKFNNSVGNNIITYNYDSDLSDKILELANTELNSSSEKCKSADCELCNYNTLCNYKCVKNDLQEVKELKKANGKIKLTDAQKQVIDVENGNYRINSVAGSGKTTVMTLRVIELLKRGYKPQDIFMITFTNKGAEELREKISYWIKYYNIRGINKRDFNIFTFNSFGANIIEKEWETLGFTQQPTLATNIQINDTIKELLKEYSDIKWLNYKNPLINYPNAKGAFVQLLNYFNLIKSFNYDKNSLIDEVLLKEKSECTTDKLNKKAEIIFKLYDEFNNSLKEKNLLQYQDQVLYLIELFKNDSKLIEKYGYQHIIVDEYQDTDFSQVDLLHILQLYSKSKSLMVVGDNSQSVYGFRNTTPENILDFDKDFNNVKDIFLLENFRSTPQICNVANELDKLNIQRIDKNIISKKTNGEIPKLVHFKTLDDEYNGIVDLIQEKINDKIPLHEICCIARTKKELLEIQKYLNEKNIPNIIEASERYIDNSNVKHIINLAKFFKNNELDYYLAEDLYIYKNFVSGNDKEFVAVKDFQEDIVLQLEEINKIENSETKEQEKINFFLELITPLSEIDIVAKSFIEDLCDKAFHSFNQLLDYLCKLELYQDNTAIEKDDKKYNAVVLTTAHSSKGKEWSVVFNSINKYKYKENMNNLNALEEERRLLFVSITRAKNELYILCNTNQNKSRNKGKYCKFADELKGVELIEK